MDPKFVKEVLENQATIPKEKTYTKKEVLEDDGVAAVLKNSSDQEHGAVVTVRAVYRDANDEVHRVEEIDLNTDEPCRSRLDRPKSTVYFMKVLIHIIKTLGHTCQYIYVLPYVYIRPSSTKVTLAVKKGPMEELLYIMKWICLTFRPPPDQPCFSFGLEDKDRKAFSLKPFSTLDKTKGTSPCCRKLFGNAMIACEEWSDKLNDCSFFMDMPFNDMKTRTKCKTLKEVSGGITLGGPDAILVPIRYTPDHRGIIWCYEEGEKHMDRAKGHTEIRENGWAQNSSSRT